METKWKVNCKERLLSRNLSLSEIKSPLLFPQVLRRVRDRRPIPDRLGCRLVTFDAISTSTDALKLSFCSTCAFLLINRKACFSSASWDESIFSVNLTFLRTHCLFNITLWSQSFHSETSQNVGLSRFFLLELTHSALFSLHDNWCYFFTYSSKVWAQAFQTSSCLWWLFFF